MRGALLPGFEFAQAADRLLDHQRAAEEDAAAAGVECREAGEGRAEARAVPLLPFSGEPTPRQPLAQTILDLVGEGVGRVEFLERGEKFARARAKPGLEERGQPPPLLFDIGAVGGVERDQWRLRAAEDVDVGHALAAPARLHRAEDLVGRAGGIGLARSHRRKVFRQGRAEPRAEDCQHQVTSAGLGDLGLEGLVR